MTTDRSYEIGERYRDGESIMVLATRFGISRQRVYQIAKETGDLRPRIVRPKKIKPPRSPKGRGPDIITTRLSGLSYGQIAKALGISATTVQTALKRWRPDLMGKNLT